MEGPGCFECGGTGFRGRTAIHELLDLSDRIRELILDRRPASEIKRVAREEGMTFLRENRLSKKVRLGITTLKETGLSVRPSSNSFSALNHPHGHIKALLQDPPPQLAL